MLMNMKKALFRTVCASAVLMGGCVNGAGFLGANVVRSSGNIVNKDTVVADFSSLIVSVPIDVILVQVEDGSAPSVSLSLSDNILPFIKVESKGGRLELSVNSEAIKDGKWRGYYLDVAENEKITVRASVLEEIRVAGSGDLTSDAVKAGDLAVGVSGSGSIEIKRLTVERAVTATVTGSGDLDLGEVGCASFSAKVSGSGELLAKGDFGPAALSITGSGEMALSGKATTVDVRVTGSGDVTFTGTASSVEANVTGSGRIDLSGLDCDDVAAHVTGSGTVRK